VRLRGLLRNLKIYCGLFKIFFFTYVLRIAFKTSSSMRFSRLVVGSVNNVIFATLAQRLEAMIRNSVGWG